MEALTQHYLPYLTFVLAIYLAYKGQFISKDNAARDGEIQLLKKQVALFWRMVEEHMTTVLHSPHTPDRDKLLEKMQSKERLSPEELNELAEDLEGVINDATEGKGNRATAVFLLAAVERYRQCLDGGSEAQGEGVDPITPCASTSDLDKDKPVV